MCHKDCSGGFPGFLDGKMRKKGGSLQKGTNNSGRATSGCLSNTEDMNCSTPVKCCIRNLIQPFFRQYLYSTLFFPIGKGNPLIITFSSGSCGPETCHLVSIKQTHGPSVLDTTSQSCTENKIQCPEAGNAVSLNGNTHSKQDSHRTESF